MRSSKERQNVSHFLGMQLWPLQDQEGGDAVGAERSEVKSLRLHVYAWLGLAPLFWAPWALRATKGRAAPELRGAPSRSVGRNP